MTFAIHASKNGESVVTVRIRPDAAIDKALLWESFGWQVHITDSSGRQFDVPEFDRLLWTDPKTVGRTLPSQQSNDPNLTETVSSF